MSYISQMKAQLYDVQHALENLHRRNVDILSYIMGDGPVEGAQTEANKPFSCMTELDQILNAINIKLKQLGEQQELIQNFCGPEREEPTTFRGAEGSSKIYTAGGPVY